MRPTPAAPTCDTTLTASKCQPRVGPCRNRALTRLLTPVPAPVPVAGGARLPQATAQLRLPLTPRRFRKTGARPIPLARTPVAEASPQQPTQPMASPAEHADGRSVVVAKPNPRRRAPAVLARKANAPSPPFLQRPRRGLVPRLAA